MAGQGGGLEVILPWGGEDHVFKLRLGEWRRVEAKCNAGPEEIAARLAPTATAIDAGLSVTGGTTLGLVGKWRVDDVREVILQGLIGGGMDQMKATVLVNDYFETTHTRSAAATAFAIVMASLEGLASSVKSGEPKGRGKAPRPSRKAARAGATSTGAQGAAATPQSKPTA